MTNIVFCGLPGVGKTSTAAALAHKLGWLHIDTDACLVHLHNQYFQPQLTCRQIYQAWGEKHFCLLERQVVMSLLACQSHVISIGGGTLDRANNMSLLKKMGQIIYLTNDLALIFERLMATGIPAYLDAQNPFQSFQQLAAKRDPIYRAAANMTYYADNHSSEALANELFSMLES